MLEVSGLRSWPREASARSTISGRSRASGAGRSLAGVIVGKAIYEGAFAVEAAVSALDHPVRDP